MTRDPEHVGDLVMARYFELFPNYEWSDSHTGLDLMVAEIKTLRHEAHERARQHNIVVDSLHSKIEACEQAMAGMVSRTDFQALNERYTEVERSFTDCADRLLAKLKEEQDALEGAKL